MIKIITDSTNDLSKDMLEKLDVDVIPLNVSFSSGSYLDGVEITTEELYKKVSELDEIPKTAAIPIMTFVDYFSKYINQGYDVIYFGISRQMSRTYENALLAKEELESDKIYTAGSNQISYDFFNIFWH